MKRAVILASLVSYATYAQPVNTQKNLITLALGIVGIYTGARLVATHTCSTWACAAERWSTWAAAREETVQEKIQRDYAEPHNMHELAGYYAALADIDLELSCLLYLKASPGFLRNAVLPEELLDQRLLALIALRQEIIESTTAVRTRSRALGLGRAAGPRAQNNG